MTKHPESFEGDDPYIRHFIFHAAACIPCTPMLKFRIKHKKTSLMDACVHPNMETNLLCAMNENL